MTLQRNTRCISYHRSIIRQTDAFLVSYGAPEIKAIHSRRNDRRFAGKYHAPINMFTKAVDVEAGPGRIIDDLVGSCLGAARFVSSLRDLRVLVVYFSTLRITFFLTSILFFTQVQKIRHSFLQISIVFYYLK